MSLYLSLDQQYETTEAAVKGTTEIANNINGVIENYYNSYLLPKMGVDPKYNKTFFKTELVAESIIFLETKKNYAFNMIAKEGKVFNPAETNYVGISVVKSDVAPFTKDFITYLTEEIALNKNITTKDQAQTALKNITKKYWEKVLSSIDNLDFTYISTPCKWGNTDYEREPTQIIAMRLFNTITNTETFKPNSYGMLIPIKINNPATFNDLIKPIRNKNQYYLNNITVDKIKYIVLPYDFNKDLLIAKLNDFHIKIDQKDIWDKLINTVAERIIQTIKQTYKFI